MAFNTLDANRRKKCRKNKSTVLTHTHIKETIKNNLGTQTKNMHSIFPIQVDMYAQNQNLHNFKQDTEMMPQMHYKH